MKTIAILPLLLAAATQAPAASPFDGTWKADIASLKLPTKPDTYLLQGGTFACKTCLPPFAVPADGRFHAVTGHPYFDATAVKIVDPHTVTLMSRKGAKLVYTETDTISADGRTLKQTVEGHSAATGVAFSNASTATRVGPAPAGAHALSGSWRTVSVQSASDSGTLMTLKETGNALTLSVPTGETYTATFGGPPVVQANDPGRTMITVKRLAPNHIVETDTRDGKPVGIYDMTVSADGRTLTSVNTDPRNGHVSTVKMLKQ